MVPGRHSGKVALITGGTSGIGLACAGRILAEGAEVAITGRDERLGRQAESALGRGSMFVVADAGDHDAVQRSIEAVLDRFGRLDILVNNAGIALEETLMDTPIDQFDMLMAVNVRGCFLYARGCFAALCESRGTILNVGSDAGLRGEQPVGAYSVSKAAVVMMSNILALDGAAHGVRSNCVCPGATAPGMRHIGPALDPDRGDDPTRWPRAPIGRIGAVEDVAASISYLASDEARFISGAVLLIDGAAGAGLYA